jgi:hypothetical protein
LEATDFFPYVHEFKPHTHTKPNAAVGKLATNIKLQILEINK